MKIKFDFLIHWLYAIVWILLGISGFGMVGAKYGWIVNFNYATASYIHRVSAAFFIILTLVSIVNEIIRYIKSDTKPQIWSIVGKSGYQVFTFISSLIFIITGAIIWVCLEFGITQVAFALLLHEYLSYIFTVSIIWHIYKKSHALIINNKKKETQNVSKNLV